MAKSVNQKIKLLRLLEILKSDSDEENLVSTNEIIERLKAQGIECGRKALYDDIRLLNEYGYDIMTAKGRQNMYYVVDRAFDVPELRILLDAVQSAAFITKKKTAELADKISALAGTHRGELLKQTTVIFDTVKHGNERIYYSIEAIDRGIAENKKVSFCYFDIGIDGNRIYRRDKERYTVNPVGLIFSNGFHYLVCYNDKRKLLTNYRIDRMDSVEVENSERTYADCVKEFDSYKEQNLAFNMFAGEVECVTLYVHNSLAEVVFDKVGQQSVLSKADDEHFTVYLKVQVSPVFLCWCAMFGDRLKIIAPKKVADELVKLIKNTLSQYAESEV
jgi:predicted DNA-binding transcriptional regulator YafY